MKSIKKIKYFYGLLGITFLYCPILNAQSDSSKIFRSKYISINIGTGIPLAHFAQLGGDGAGHFDSYGCLTGFFINAENAYPIKNSSFSDIVNCSFGINAFNVTEYINLPYSYPTNYFQNDFFTETSLTDGLCYSTKTDVNSCFDVRIFVGGIFLTCPEIYINDLSLPINSVGGILIESTSDAKKSNILSLLYGGGLGWRKVLSNKGLGFIRFDVYSSTKQNVITQYYKPDTGSKYTTTVSSINLLMLNITLGYGFVIRKNEKTSGN